MWSRFVALGDSFTEGLDDSVASGGFRGWADRIADLLVVGDPDVQYANLAVRGRLLEPILAEQVPAALAMKPDLVTLAGGGNDILRPRCDLDQLGERFYDAVGVLVGSGATVVVFAGFDPILLPLGTRLRRRAIALNTFARRAAFDHGALLVDLWNLPELRRPSVWSEDRLHLNTQGHRWVTAAVACALGLAHDPFTQSPQGPAVASPSWFENRRQDAAWTTHHLAPWVGRRLRGRSSGDGVDPKRPELAPVTHPSAR